MIEKLAYEAIALMAESRKQEGESQAAYENRCGHQRLGRSAAEGGGDQDADEGSC